MKYVFLHYPKCSTCQKAKAYLDTHSIPYISRDITKENPTYEELKEWTSRSTLPLKNFFNTSGILYKEMHVKDKLPTMTIDEQLQLLSTDGMLVKRPLLVSDKTVIPGFKEESWCTL